MIGKKNVESSSQRSSSRNGSWLRKVAALVIGLAIALIVAELVVRWFVPVRNVGPALSVYDPVYGKRLKKDVSILTKSPEFSFRLTTNSLGFRGPEPNRDLRGAVLFLGDSFTEGYGVDDGEEFPSLIGKELEQRFGPEQVPVVNAGIGNAGNGHWVKLLNNEAPHFEPRFVVLQLCRNDFGDNQRERLFALSPSGELQELPVPPAGWVRHAQTVVEAIPGLSSSHLVALIKQATLRVVRDAQAPRAQPLQNMPPKAERTPSNEREQLTYALVAESLRLCRQRDWPAIVVGVGLTESAVAHFKDVCNTYETEFLNLPSKTERPDLYFHIDGHWNPLGHAFAAEIILDRILSHHEFIDSADGSSEPTGTGRPPAREHSASLE